MHSKNQFHLAASFTLLLFVILGYTVKFYEKMLLPVDEQLQSFMRQGRTEILDHFFVTFTQCFNPVPATLLSLFLLLLLLLNKRKIEAVWFASSLVLITMIANPVLKLVFQRTRPTITHLVHESSFSFPSGHSSFATCLFATCFIFLGFWVKNQSLRILLQIFSVLLWVLVLYSRVYVGVHYPTDVLGGALLALSWILFSFPTFERFRFQWRFTGKQP